MKFLDNPYMELQSVLIKHFTDFISGKEVDAIAERKTARAILPGEKVLAFKNSLAVVTSLPVPHEKLDLSIGVEAVVTEVNFNEPGVKPVQHLKVKKT
jgi:hypothetical protein